MLHIYNQTKKNKKKKHLLLFSIKAKQNLQVTIYNKNYGK